MLRAIVLIFLWALLPSAATAEKRVALVIGNSAYQHTGKLANPKNDATDIRAALEGHGFQVIEGIDLDKTAFDRKVRDFATALEGAEVGLFFFAGHGVQVGGQNYLLPVDAELRSSATLDFEMVRVDVIHRLMERLTTTNVLFLDACRDNPLTRNLARTMGTRSAEIGKGLAAVESGIGTLISFSTQPGNVALDGTGRNSPFAGALVKHVSTSNDDLSAILIAVRNDVMKGTQKKQVPWEHSALTGKFYFSVRPAPAVPAQIGPSEASQAWALVRDSTNQSVLEAYAQQFERTVYAQLARVRIEELKKQQIALSAPSPSATPPPQVPADSTVIARALQEELRRVGCDPGNVDSAWGAKARKALADFSRLTKISIPGDEPSDAALRAVTQQKGRICPSPCGAGETEVGGKCVAKAKPDAPKTKATQTPGAGSQSKASADDPAKGSSKGSGSCWAAAGGTTPIVACSDPRSSGKKVY